ncbi:dTDP-4-dehydrorhamnose 3,5-epimerase family protein [Rhodoferax antarcticus]|uniref:dTDP-4-dehydrorhamnose 3,5-epimerase family protein n=1 Tax=Rhodoferax antarcticus TaxID=81479 RepID=UPI002224099D|nr:dTDP-4-dehydrorhamnose 3,5-epimerase family protein [Rhodoferax antarcticus]MCW2312611.1 dTDP-4-dehydrorhamnose 3,5-epimerase/CDP-3, 6-dideoxy-D-glycero-D-glycero-4-hexulose-5-epimerase [Rhodoferax antarcticus]
MEILKELLPGCFLLQPNRFVDSRGSFVKTYHEGLCEALGVNLEIREEFYSVSRKNVIRGMHFQLPPNEHDKLVYCTRGAVTDVQLDLRKGPGYGKVAFAELSGENAHLVFIPKGIAHGFAALTDEALMLYKTSTVHAPESDCGIRWDSFGFDWGIAKPIISARDQQHSVLVDFISPF